MKPTPPQLPKDYLVQECLAARDGAEVWRVAAHGQNLIMRIEPARGPEVLAELEVLATVRHPRLVALVDFGHLADGRQFVTRPFIKGHTMGPKDAEAQHWLDLLAALEALHATGFVHGDLKPNNVLVDEEGGVHLTDFGFAATGAQQAGSIGGSLYYLAPEQLVGAPPSVASDLFAVGVMAHELIVGERRSADLFYADFPRLSFLEAAGTPADRLPEWIRTWVQRLLAIEPAERFASARAAARDLAQRANLPEPEGAQSCDPHLLPVAPFPRRLDWLDEALEHLGLRGGALWLALPAGEDPMALRLALGLEAIKADVALDTLDLARLAHDSSSTLDLDHAISAFLTDRERAKIVTYPASVADDPWALRACELLVRAWNQTPAECRGALAVLAHSPPVLRDQILWRHLPLAAIGAAELGAAFVGVLEFSPELDRDAFVEALLEASGGTVTALNSLLKELVSRGAIVAGAELPRVRAQALDALLALRAQSAPAPAGLLKLASTERTLLATVYAASGLETGLESAQLAALLSAGWLLIQGGRALVAPNVRAWLEADFDAWPDVHRALWESLKRGKRVTGNFRERLEAELEESLHAVAAKVEGASRVAADVWERVRESGAPERVLRTAARLTRLLKLQGRSLPPALLGEEGLAELAAGSPGRCEAHAQTLAALGRQGDAQAGAMALRLVGRLAEVRHEPERAQEAFSRALELDPSAAGEVAVARANAWYAAGQFDAVIKLVAASERSEGVSPRQLDYLRSVAAMIALRRGHADRAAAELGALLQRAERLGDRQREAALAVNLATVHRRSGDHKSALEMNERAVAAYREVGHLPGLALAKNQLGGLLRERGELARAAGELSEAADLRGRLGDRSGQALGRGMLGLLYAERGHGAQALEELSTARAQLEGAQARQFGPLLDARCEEWRARLGRAPLASTATLDASRDPRVALALGRAALLRGKTDAGTRLLRRAVDLAGGLGDVASAAEARFVLAHGPIPVRRVSPVEGEAQAPLVAEDREVLTCVLTNPADLDVAAATALAERLEARGRDDRAARLWCVIALAAPEGPGRARAHQALERCALGASALETERMQNALFGFPDPNPSDVDRIFSGTADTLLEEMEMDIVRLLEINHRLVEQEDLESLLGSIVDEALIVTSAERGYLILEEQGVLRLDTARNSWRGGLQETDLEVSGSVVRRCLDAMQRLRVSDASEDPLFGGAQSVRDLDLRSILCAPFRVDDSLRGVIYLDNRVRRGAFDERAERLIGLLVDQAALAISQVRRREEIARLNEELSERIVVRETDLAVARRELAEAGLPRPVGGLVGRSPALLRVKAMIERAAPTDLSILVTGESGTGKELAARAIHDLSKRSSGPFVSENCAAMPPSLIEAELFGVVRGAFTGAESDRPGLFERAEGGTLFLDEIGEMPLELQAKLLRALETREVRPVGGTHNVPVDFRLVAATNRDLRVEADAERFRSDLYYRICGIELEMPPLRTITDDIPEFVEHFLDLESRRVGEVKPIAPPVLERLVRRPWQGNVRELRNEVRRLYALSGTRIEDPELVRMPTMSTENALDGTLADIEKRAILRALEHCGGDKRAVADHLGISRAKVYQRLKEWGTPGEAD